MATQDEIQQAVRDPDRLQALRELKILDTEAEPAFDRLTSLASDLLNAPISLVSLVDSDRQWFKSQIGLGGDVAEERQTPLSHSFCKHVVATSEPLIVSDAPHHPELKDNLAVRDLGVMAYAGVPLRLNNGQTIGSLCVVDTTPREWTAEEIRILSDIAAATITELELRLEVHKRREAEAAVRHLNDDLRAQAAHLRTMNEELRAFSHTVAHDLRGPLGLVMGSFQVLEQVGGDDLTPHMMKALQTGSRTAETMQRIIDSLLLFAEAREKEVTFEPVDMVAITQQALGRFTYERERNHITIIIEPDLPVVYGYGPWLEEVIANLISNAIKYIGATNPNPTIRIHGEQVGGIGRIHITDNGIGIRPEDQERLGQTFARFNDQAPGSGLGISIVLRILKRLGGQLALESEVGVGSTFSVELPLGNP